MLHPSSQVVLAKKKAVIGTNPNMAKGITKEIREITVIERLQFTELAMGNP